MCKSRHILLAAVACASLGALSARADDAADLQQVKVNASQGQSATTGTQVSEYVDGHADVITSIIRWYRGYYGNIQKLTAQGPDDRITDLGSNAFSTGSSGGNAVDAITSSASASTGVSFSGGASSSSSNVLTGASASASSGNQSLPTDASPQTGTLQTSSSINMDGVQPSTTLKMDSLKTSDGLQISHLSTYPALPDVAPVSSVTSTNVTPGQRAYAAKVQRDMRARQKELQSPPDWASW